MKLSIIVPVYNSASFLKKCLNSLLNQGLAEGDYEIICVNDGSTDGSLDILKEYSFNNRYIKVLSQSNAGVGAARNNGIDNALGDYVCFVDSDDYLVPQGLSHIMPYASGNIDMIRYWCKIVTCENESAESRFCGDALYSGGGVKFIQSNGLCTFSVCWLYRRSFLNQYKIRFCRYRMNEDLLFVSTALFQDPQIVSTSFRIYHYVINPSSATTNRSKEHACSCVDDIIASDNVILKLVDELGLDSACKQKVMESLRGRITMVVSRAFAARYSHSNFELYTAKLKNTGLVPIPEDTIREKIINKLCSSWTVYRLLSYVYNYIFAPFILPHLNRN